MASNRGNASGSNGNLPSTRPNGVTKSKSSEKSKGYNYVDVKTMRNIGIVMNGLTEYVKKLSGNIEDFNEVILKDTKNIVDTKKKLDDESKELDSQLEEMRKHYFGRNKKKVDEFEKYIALRKKELENQEIELYKDTQKNLIKQSFKNETSSKRLNYIDSDFSKGNNLKAVSNEYYGELEKLKSLAVDTYGEGFENQEEYKKALMNLNDKYAQNMKDAWKEDFKENHKVLGAVSDGIKDTFKENKQSIMGILGPLNLFLSPMKEFFGGFGLIFKGIKGGIKGLFGKFTKKNPSASDVMKSGAFGVGALYIGHKLDKLFDGGEEKKDKKNGILSKIPIIGKLIPSLTSLLKSIPILGTFLRGAKLLGKSFGKNALGKGGNFAKFFKSGATKTAFKAMGPMMIVTSLIEMTIDGIKGFFKSEEWGASKISSALGGFLGGASEGGLKNAFSSMGKWALLGAGIGSVVPVVGTIAGGLIGGAIGGILGFIGGKRLSKAFDAIGNFFKNVWNGAIEGLKKAWTKTKVFSQLAKDKTIMKSKAIKNAVIGFVSNSVNAISEKWSKTKNFMSDSWSKLKNLGKEGMESFNSGTFFSEFVPKLLDSIKDKLLATWDWVKESPFGNFVKKLFENIENGMTKFFKENPVGKWINDSLITPLVNAFKSMGVYFEYIKASFDKGGIVGGLGGMKDIILGSDEFKEYQTNYMKVDDAIIKTDGSIIKTNPKDTLVALKDVPLSMNKVREETNKSLNGSLSNIGGNEGLEKKLTTIIDVLSKILDKNVNVTMPPQTRADLDMIMSGGMI